MALDPFGHQLGGGSYLGSAMGTAMGAVIGWWRYTRI